MHCYVKYVRDSIKMLISITKTVCLVRQNLGKKNENNSEKLVFVCAAQLLLYPGGTALDTKVFSY